MAFQAARRSRSTAGSCTKCFAPGAAFRNWAASACSDGPRRPRVTTTVLLAACNAFTMRLTACSQVTSFLPLRGDLSRSGS